MSAGVLSGRWDQNCKNTYKIRVSIRFRTSTGNLQQTHFIASTQHDDIWSFEYLWGCLDTSRVFNVKIWGDSKHFQSPVGFSPLQLVEQQRSDRWQVLIGHGQMVRRQCQGWLAKRFAALPSVSAHELSFVFSMRQQRCATVMEGVDVDNIDGTQKIVLSRKFHHFDIFSQFLTNASVCDISVCIRKS